MKFIGCYNKSVILTYVGIAFSIVGMFFIEHMPIAMICLMFAGICDMFDGYVARMCKRTDTEKEFGIQIDSLCDVISFLVYPAALLRQICLVSPIMGVDVKIGVTIVSCIAIIYVVAGVTRLAWFNISTDGHTTYYQGMPVTFIAIILPLFYLLFHTTELFGTMALVLFVTVAFLFIWNIKVKKLKGIWYGIFSALAIVVTAYIALVLM